MTCPLSPTLSLKIHGVLADVGTDVEYKSPDRDERHNGLPDRGLVVYLSPPEESKMLAFLVIQGFSIAFYGLLGDGLWIKPPEYLRQTAEQR
jgi:hypothetical protein